MERRWEQVGGAGAIAFVVLAIGAIVAAGSVPKPDSSTARIGQYVVDHRTGVLLSCFLFSAATIALLVFMSTLVAQLRAADDRGSPVALIVLMGGISIVLISWIGTLAQATLAYRVGALGGSTTRALFDLGNLANASIGFGAVLFLGGVALGIGRLQGMPSWLVPATAALAVAEFASTFQIFPRSGAFAPGGVVTYGFFAAFMLWTLVVGVTMVRVPAEAVASEGAALGGHTPAPV